MTTPPPGWGQPQTGWVQPPAYPAQSPVSGLAKAGALILALFSLLWILAGGLFVFLGREIGRNADAFPGLANVGTVGDAVIVVGAVLLVIGILQLLSGIFGWRGSGAWRVIGIVISVLFGLLTGLGLLGSLRDSTGSSIGFGAVFAGGYIYTAIAWIFAYRRR